MPGKPRSLFASHTSPSPFSQSDPVLQNYKRSPRTFIVFVFTTLNSTLFPGTIRLGTRGTRRRSIQQPGRRWPQVLYSPVIVLLPSVCHIILVRHQNRINTQPFTLYISSVLHFLANSGLFFPHVTTSTTLIHPQVAHMLPFFSCSCCYRSAFDSFFLEHSFFTLFVNSFWGCQCQYYLVGDNATSTPYT